MNPSKPLNEREILAQIGFHEAGASWYDGKESPSMAKWSREQVTAFRQQLRALDAPGREVPDVLPFLRR